jgi:hypothetical protein
MMVTDEYGRSEDMTKSFRQLDLYHHSLRNLGEELVLQAREPVARPPAELLARCLRLAQDCSELIQGLEGLLGGEDTATARSAVQRVGQAIRRATSAGTPTLHMVSIWRVVEATDEFLSSLAPKYGYTRLTAELEGGLTDAGETNGDQLASLFAEYGNAMSTTPDGAGELGPPFMFGILRWRGTRLFYVERVEDGARWIELDPNHEPQITGQEATGAELVQAHTIEGHQIELLLDSETEETEVDAYIRSQTGSEYYVSGYQVVAERQGKGGRYARRR